MSGVAGRSGRKKFVPTPDHRLLVKLLATRGIPQEHIRRLIRNPQTGRPVSIKTLGRAFATEIKTAKAEFNFHIARFVMDTILGRKPVNAKPIKNERLRLTLAIFVAKTRLGWTVANRQHQLRGPIDACASRRSLEAKIARLARRFQAGEPDGSSAGGARHDHQFCPAVGNEPRFRAADQATLPPPHPGVRFRVRLQAPPGLGAVQTFSGRHINVGLDGTIEMSAEDAQFYIRDGWTKLAEGTTEEEGAAEPSKPQPMPQPGSMEWFEMQKRTAEQSGGPA